MVNIIPSVQDFVGKSIWTLETLRMTPPPWWSGLPWKAAPRPQHRGWVTLTWGHNQREPQTLGSVPLAPIRHSPPGSGAPGPAVAHCNHLKERRLLLLQLAFHCDAGYRRSESNTFPLSHMHRNSVIYLFLGVFSYPECVSVSDTQMERRQYLTANQKGDIYSKARTTRWCSG